MFKILQWNCQSIKHKKPELELRSVNYDLILITETWLNISTPKFKIKNFDTIRNDRSLGKGGGTAILVKGSIKYCEFPLQNKINNKIEACAIRITWQGKPLIIVSIYVPPDKQISTAEFN